MKNQKSFRIGLSMAGAVSAGAYTAGVVDYLLEALENWQKAKDLGLSGVPQHEVHIEVMSGASAGGMTAVLTAAAIRRDFPPVHQRNYTTDASKKNPLYDTWVNLTEDSKSDMMDQMLATEDILGSPESNPLKEVRSVFNSLFVEKIARQIFDATVKAPQMNRPYFANDYELLTTLTNLRGFNYELEFFTATGLREDRMIGHKDLFHFQHNPSGTYKNDGKIPFHLNSEEGLNKNLLMDAAIATGAFPVGLAPRLVTRDPKYVNDNQLLKISHGKACIVDPLTDYSAVCVDGGIINNEPYDLTETILTSRRREALKRSRKGLAMKHFHLPRNATDFDTTILMIDPFPNYDDKPPENYFGLQSVKTNILQLFATMRQQLLVKSDLLERAYNDNDYTRFMIAPVRSKNGISQKYSLACGALGGFGGFFGKQFRIHDFMLGRRNCQRFIQQYYCVPVQAKNPLIKFGYRNMSEEELKLYLTNVHQALPIVPDIRLTPDQKSIERPPEEEEFPYPSIELRYLMSLEKKVETRLRVVIDNLDNCFHPESEPRRQSLHRQKIRKGWWISRKVIHPFSNLISKLLFSIGKRAVKRYTARKFIEMVIADMTERAMLKTRKSKN